MLAHRELRKLLYTFASATSVWKRRIAIFHLSAVGTSWTGEGVTDPGKRIGMPARWFTLLLSILTALMPVSAAACLCNPGEEMASVVERSDAIFRGRVLSVDSPGMFTDEKWANTTWIVRLEVITAWKGPLEPEILVGTNETSSACGVSFKKDAEYLVFATLRSPSNTLWTTTCHRTEVFPAASSSLRYVETHLPALPLNPKSSGLFSCASTATSASLPALLLLAGLLRHRQLLKNQRAGRNPETP